MLFSYKQVLWSLRTHKKKILKEHNYSVFIPKISIIKEETVILQNMFLGLLESSLAVLYIYSIIS